MLFATPPVLRLPQAEAFQYRATDAAFVDLTRSASLSSLALPPPPDIDGLMLPEGIAASFAADFAGINRNRSVAHRRQALSRIRQPTNSGRGAIRIWTMTFPRRRAFHGRGASWLFLCAMGSGAMAQDVDAAHHAAAGNHGDRTQPDRAAKHDPVTNACARRARVPAPNREPAPPTQPVPVAAAPQQGVLPS